MGGKRPESEAEGRGVSTSASFRRMARQRRRRAFSRPPLRGAVLFASPLRRSSSPYLWIDTTRRRCLMRGENHGVAGSLGLQTEPRTSFPLSAPTIKTPPRMILTMALCLPKKSVVTCCPVLLIDPDTLDYRGRILISIIGEPATCIGVEGMGKLVQRFGFLASANYPILLAGT